MGNYRSAAIKVLVSLGHPQNRWRRRAGETALRLPRCVGNRSAERTEGGADQVGDRLALLAQIEFAGNCRQHEVRVADGAEFDKTDSVREVRRYLGGDLEGKARLANAARTGQRYQRYVVCQEHVTDDRQVVVPANQRRARPRQCRGPGQRQV